jgi:hypothetical protein
MNLRFRDNHLTEDQLLLFVDGEMGANAVKRCGAHIEHCWRCRARVAALQDTIRSFVTFLNEDYPRQCPPPPGQWRGFAAKLQRASAGKRRGAEAVSLSGIRKLWQPLLAGTGALLAVMIPLALLLERPASLSAAQFLRRAMDSQSGAQAAGPPPAILVRVGRKTFRKPAGEGLGEPAGDAAEERFVARVLEANHFDWHGPLSARSFMSWRDSLAGKEDRIAQEGELLTLSTVALRQSAQPPIVLATLTVRARDFHPVKELLTLGAPESGTIELTESPESAPPPTPQPQLAASAPARVPPARKPAPALRSPAVVPMQVVASAALELRILAQIHAIGADLGQEVAVTRTPGRQLSVNAVVESAERKKQILDALAASSDNPAVRLNVQTAAEAVSREAPAERGPGRIVTMNVSAGNGTIPATPALMAYFASQGVPDSQQTAQLQQFSERLVQHSTAALLHALALYDLADRFQPAERRLFDQSERRTWEQAMRDHAQAVADNIAAVRSQLQPVYGMDDDDPAGAGVAPSAGWRTQSAALLEPVKRQHEIVHAAFTVSNEGLEKASAIAGSAFWRSLSSAQALATLMESQTVPELEQKE